MSNRGWAVARKHYVDMGMLWTFLSWLSIAVYILIYNGFNLAACGWVVMITLFFIAAGYWLLAARADLQEIVETVPPPAWTTKEKVR